MNPMQRPDLVAPLPQMTPMPVMLRRPLQTVQSAGRGLKQVANTTENMTRQMLLSLPPPMIGKQPVPPMTPVTTQAPVKKSVQGAMGRKIFR